uniref:Protein kinase domain-containing protein n=1 Tax=Romanomermis culicivorax TaxID=13658 RepID=A0A915K645_ROMCU
MTLLGPSLVALADLCPKSAFTGPTMANIAKQTIEALQFLHNAGFLHRYSLSFFVTLSFNFHISYSAAIIFVVFAFFFLRDIKPANFVTGLGVQKHEIFMVDYGFARRFLDDDGRRLPPRARAPFRGTSPYASINTYECKEQAPADDLWSLFYMLVDLRTGTLPWTKFPNHRQIDVKYEQLVARMQSLGEPVIVFAADVRHLAK